MDDLELALKETEQAVHALVVFRRAERTIRKHEGDVVRAHGLTPMQFGVLDVLLAKGPLSVGDIMASMLATSGNMTVVIRNMERDGYIRREEDAKDKRRFLISLTDKGEEKIRAVLPDHVRHIDDIFRVLSDQDKEELIRILTKFKNV